MGIPLTFNEGVDGSSPSRLIFSDVNVSINVLSFLSIQEVFSQILALKVSALIRLKLDGFSVECLIHFLNNLGQNIDIVVRQKPPGRKQAIINVYHVTGCGYTASVSMGCSII